MTEALKACEYHAETVPGVRVVAVEDEYGEDSGWQVFCDRCGAAGPIKHDEDDAIAAWNTRPAERVPEEVVEVYRFHKAYAEMSVSHSSCAAAIRGVVFTIYGPEGVKQLEAQPHD